MVNSSAVPNTSDPKADTVPPHLGGHLHKVHVDRGTLKYLIQKFDIATMLDIGCGPGWMYSLADNFGLNYFGIDGDPTVLPDDPEHFRLHDFTISRCNSFSDDSYDLAWSVEVLEHVEERFIPNLMHAFSQCKYAVVTAAPPGHTGHHHVNCRTEDYWKGVFAGYGFRFDPEVTAEIRKISTMQKPFMQHHGLFFRPFQEGDSIYV